MVRSSITQLVTSCVVGVGRPFVDVATVARSGARARTSSTRRAAAAKEARFAMRIIGYVTVLSLALGCAALPDDPASAPEGDLSGGPDAGPDAVGPPIGQSRAAQLPPEQCSPGVQCGNVCCDESQRCCGGPTPRCVPLDRFCCGSTSCAATSRCETNVATGTGRCVSGCPPERTCGATACCPVGSACVSGSCQAPDLTIDESVLRGTWMISTPILYASDCEVTSGCAGGTGRRSLLRFQTTVANVGAGDLVLGNPASNSSMFSYATCRAVQEPRSLVAARLIDPNTGVVLATQVDASMCARDATPVASVSGRPPARFTCADQGISRGWAATMYYISTSQFIDVTTVALSRPGNYALEVVANPDHTYGESSYANNVVRVGVTIPPLNDDRWLATELPLVAGETTVSGTTAGASHDGPAVACRCTSDPNVWYRFTLAQREVVYLDLATPSTDPGGGVYDSSLFLTDGAGTLVPAQPEVGSPFPGLCNDDAGCTTGGFARGTQARTFGVLDPGTYFVAVGGCGDNVQFNLHFQHMPVTTGSRFVPTPLSGAGVTAESYLTGTSGLTSSCAGGSTGEDVRWFVTCGGLPQRFSLCRSDGGSYLRQSGGAWHDPVMYLRSAQTNTEVLCNDDGWSTGGTACEGTGGDLAQYGSRLDAASLPRGLNAVVIDDRSGNAEMLYNLAYSVH
jgi:hypothetical protein